MTVLERMHERLSGPGWMVASARALGLPAEEDVTAALAPALRPDPRGPGKLHARDVVAYDLGAVPVFAEHDSAAHVDGTDDYSRFLLMDAPKARSGGSEISIPAAILRMVPPSLRRPAGRISADYFRYTPGTGTGAHQDKFGDLVIIWVLARNGKGAESFLTALDGKDVMRGPVGPGMVLAFRDEMFLHGVTPLASGERDALIFITLRDGAR